MANCKILLVDDDGEDYLIMKQAFIDLDAETDLDYVNSASEAIGFLEALASSGQELPRIVVLDINMPLISGPQLLRQLLADPRFSSIIYVMYSTSINPIDEEECTQMGAAYCITKPVTMEEIIKVGETLLALCEGE